MSLNPMPVRFVKGALTAHLWYALPNATLPASTFTIHFSPRSSGSHFRMRLLTSMMIFWNRCCICSGLIFNSLTRRSTLLMNRTGLTRSFSA